ncbi:DUF116 domain-containing protein [Desulfovirgula thermocuniculi]|uniref:DUF116 domain-containing protein n=1 Tax=Desulfovirgula thermocuniculi TaxID=348842 RepID=UPI000418D107|nr:DUF116 domain-containing protein [Desulfovirgula thermocuniculi]
MKPSKFLFPALLGGSLLLVVLLVAATWYLIFVPARTLAHRIIFWFAVSLLACVALLAASGFLGMVLTLAAARTCEPLQAPTRVAINTFFPVILALGRLLGISTDNIRRSFIEVNNQLVRARRVKVLPHELLLLVPHCLQCSECPHKITVHVGNCRRCGRCAIGELLALKDRYGFNMGVATGGTLARKYVRMFRPRAIVAVACERDLSSGILDTNPIPVLGVVNERPHGPCFNTNVSLAQVEGAIFSFLPVGARRAEG